jgi:hypothetical protein
MPEVDSSCFQVYLNWLYTARFCTIQEDEDSESENEDGSDPLDKEWEEWQSCFEASDFLQDTAFQDALVDVAIEKMHHEGQYPSALPEAIYGSTQATSPRIMQAVDVAMYP